MKNSIVTFILIGMLVGTLLLPVVMFPLLGVFFLLTAIYLIIHDGVMLITHGHNHKYTQ